VGQTEEIDMSHTLTEGGQIVSHRFRMLRQVLKIVFCGSSLFGFSVFILLMMNIPGNIYIASWYHVKAIILAGIFENIEVDHAFFSQINHRQYFMDQSVPLEHVKKFTAPSFETLKNHAYHNGIKTLGLTSIIAVGMLCFFFYKGQRSKTKRHLSGPQIISSNWLKMRLKLGKKASNIKIGSLPLIKDTETQHMMITGGTGSGKTNCLFHLLDQIRGKRQKAIIVDTTGVFLDRYYRKGKDVLLNPFDDRGVIWSPWAEGGNPADYAELAEAFIPNSLTDNENYWKIASRTLFVSLMQKFADTKKTSELVRWIQYERLTTLCKALEGTKAAAHLDISSEKTASSIRSVASTHLECLENLKDTNNPFSIREWLKSENDSWLFLHCLPSQRAILRPLMAAWISSAIRGLLMLPIDLKRRIWFSIDELPSLQKIKDLETFLTESRKYGGCGILTLQSPAQLENIYGREISKVIIGNTATKVIFRELDPEIAERISRGFGEREVMETQEGISYGAHETRDSVSLSMQNKICPVVSPMQILELPVNTAYVKLAGQKVTRIQLPILR
jgi:type IV conjugative transfer system coupling protein TraD